jgi:hypothetical protein
MAACKAYVDKGSKKAYCRYYQEADEFIHLTDMSTTELLLGQKIAFESSVILNWIMNK